MTRYAAGQPVTIAVMGCRVNGPGETDAADLGLWCGPHFVNLKRGSQPLGLFHDQIPSRLKLNSTRDRRTAGEEGPLTSPLALGMHLELDPREPRRWCYPRHRFTACQISGESPRRFLWRLSQSRKKNSRGAAEVDRSVSPRLRVSA